MFNVLENHNLTIECHVDANPKAPAMWKSGNKFLKFNFYVCKLTLVLSKIRRQITKQSTTR